MSFVSKQSFVSEMQQIITVMQEQLPGRTFVLEGKAWKEKDVVTVLQSSIDTTSAGNAAQVAWRTAVAKQKAARAEAEPLVAAIKVYIGVTYGKKSELYGAMFGVPAAPGKPTSETRLAGVQQNRATRKARNTMGKRQKKAVKGVVSPVTAAPAATSPSAPSTASTTTASASSANGANGQSH